MVIDGVSEVVESNLTQDLSSSSYRTLNYFSVCTSDQRRGAYIAGMGLIWGLGSILGPVIGKSRQRTLE